MEKENVLKKEIGRRIEFVRKESKLTKEKFAKNIGITPQYLGVIEKGDSALSYDKLEKLCNTSRLFSWFYFVWQRGSVRREDQNVA